MLISVVELWLGSSIITDIVRAVAGLLHHFKALKSAGTPTFAEDYQNALRQYHALRKSPETVRMGQVRSHSVQFVQNTKN